MKKFLTLNVFCLTLFSYSQDNTLETKNNLNDLNASLIYSGTWIPAKIEDKSIKGSVYLFPNWNGIYNITNSVGNSLQSLNLNYNIKNRTLESYISKDSVIQYDINKIDFFYKSKIKYKVISNDGVNGLFQEIYYSPKIILYKEPAVSIKSGVVNPLTQEKMQQDSYEISYYYYFFINNKLEKINLGKADLFKHFEKQKSLIKEFVSKNSLDYKNEVDFCKVLNYINTI